MMHCYLQSLIFHVAEINYIIFFFSGPMCILLQETVTVEKLILRCLLNFDISFSFLSSVQV